MSNPTTNGELHLQLERTEAAWAQCAAKIDAIIQCQENVTDEEAHQSASAPAG